MIFVVSTAATAAAHQVASTEVVLTLRGRTFEAIVSTDPESLHAKLAALERPIADLIDLRFDGQRVTARVEQRSSSPDQAATIRLTGEIPRGAEHVTWSTSLVFGSYPLSILGGGTREPAVQWLQGLETSAPFHLPSARAAGLRFDYWLLGLGLLPGWMVWTRVRGVRL